MFGKKRKENKPTESVPIPSVTPESTQQRAGMQPDNINVQPVNVPTQGYSAQNSFYPHVYTQGFYPAPTMPMGYGAPQQPAPAQSRQQGLGFCNFNPTSFSEAAPILEKIKEGAVVLVNISKMPRDERVRIMDMISGAIFVLGGNITLVQDNMYSVTPPGTGD